jgi:hypothetical protein
MARDEITLNYIDETNITSGVLDLTTAQQNITVANGIAITDGCEFQNKPILLYVFQDSGGELDLYIRPGSKLSSRTASAQPNALRGGATVAIPNNKQCLVQISDTSRFSQSDVEDYDGNSGNGGEIFIDFETGFDGSNAYITAVAAGTAFTA